MTAAVDHLKKIALELQTASGKTPFEFICGTASEGLCPFEYDLLHKVTGDQLHLTIPRAKLLPTFAHLSTPLRTALALTDLPEILDLTVSITSVSEPDPREIVRAMAHAADQKGCGGDCGCGCGGH